MENLVSWPFSDLVSKGVKSYGNAVKKGRKWAVDKVSKDISSPVVQETAVFAIDCVTGVADMAPLTIMVIGVAYLALTRD